MAIKTVKFCFPTLASLTNNTLTNLTQITLYIPESGLTFRSVIVRLSMDDIITATGGSLTTKTMALRLAAVGYSTVANASLLTHSGENLSIEMAQDYTAYFTTNWSGTSMTCDFQTQINQSTGTTLGMVNVSATVEITYEYTETATQIKTVAIPLDAPVGALATAKPGTQTATIPLLDTYLPELSKVIRKMWIEISGNTAAAGATADTTLSAQIDSLTALTTGIHESGLASDRAFRYVWDITALGMTTSATHGFYIWASVAKYNHLQATLFVTYEYSDGSAAATARANSTAYSVGDVRYGLTGAGKDIAFRCTTAGTSGGSEPGTWNTAVGATTTDGGAVWTVLSVIQSLILPVNFGGIMGGPASSDASRGKAELWVPELGTIGNTTIAFYGAFSQEAALTGLNARIGTGSYVTYTDTAAALCGDNRLMIRNDADFTIVRGYNAITVDFYNTVGDWYRLNGYFIVNYTSAQHRLGNTAHNHTVEKAIASMSTVAFANGVAVSAAANIPETNYYLSNVAVGAQFIPDGTNAIRGVSFRMRGDATDWRDLGHSIGRSDAEIGVFKYWVDASQHLERYPGDPAVARVDIETARIFDIMAISTATGGNPILWSWVGLIYTYHSITFEVAGSCSGGFSGTVEIGLHRDDDAVYNPGELLLETTRSGDGAFSFPWYDNVVPLYTECSDGTKVARSLDTLAA